MSDTKPDILFPVSSPSVSSARSVAALILAAGKSTRMKSRTPKALHPLLGKPLLRWAVEAAVAAGAGRTVLVVGHQAEMVQDAMGPELEYVLQAEQKGTGHAVQMAEALLEDWDGPLLVLPGDAPLLSASLLESLVARHAQTGAAATLLTATLEDAGTYGRIVRDPVTSQVQAIVEARDASPAQLLIGEISTSVYVFQPRPLFAALRKITPQNAQGELYLTDVAGVGRPSYRRAGFARPGCRARHQYAPGAVRTAPSLAGPRPPCAWAGRRLNHRPTDNAY